MARQKISFQKLMQLAEDYGIADNPLFIQQAELYCIQMQTITMLKSQLTALEDLTVEHTYQKDSPNITANPLIKELPKHADSANKTAANLLAIITQLGRKSDKAESRLKKFLEDNE